MSWRKVDGTNWEVNTDGLYAVIRGVEAYRAIEEHSRTTKDERFFLANYFMPSIEEIEIDWNAVRPKIELRSRQFYEFVLADLPNQPENAFKNLAIMVEEGRKRKDKFRSAQQDLTRKNLNAVRRANSVNNYTLEGIKLVRDGSIATFLILATGGGAAAALGTAGQVGAIGLGTSMKGYATFQDTGNIGAAMLSASTAIATNLIGVYGKGLQKAGELSKVDQYALVVVETGLEGMRSGVQAVAEGRNAEAAIYEAVLSMGFKGLGNKLNIGNRAIPVQVVVSLATGRVTSAAGNAINAKPPPTLGKANYAGMPQQVSDTQEFVRKNVLRSVA